MVKEHTFETEFISLNEEDISSLLYSHRKHNEYHLLYGYSTSNEAAKLYDATLQRLCEKVEYVLSNWRNEGVFIKLNTRSPKDVVIDDINSENSKKILRDVEDSLPTVISERKKYPKQSNCVTPHHIVDSFTRVTTSSMKLNHGKEVIELLSKSTREYQDLLSVQTFGLRNIKGVFITLRKWHHSVVHRPYGEFRGFVYQNNLNALTQYDNFTF